MAWLPLGAACRIGSTPLSNVIAVPSPPAPPCVVTTSTASPLCRSASVTTGMRFNICWRSGVPPCRMPPPPIPLPAEFILADGAPGCAPLPTAGVELEFEVAAAPGIPGGMAAFNRIAMRCAISGGSLWSCDSDVIFTCTAFLLNRS